MKTPLLQIVGLCLACFYGPLALADTPRFSFGIIAHPVKAAADDAAIEDAIEETDADNLAFIVVSGIKAADEACSDKVYSRKKALLQESKNGVIVSLASGDWAECRLENGKPAAIGKLNRLRELFFVDEYSLGGTKIPVIRQSTNVKFRSFVENARWEIGNIMFATINLPRNNNHYVYDAGRNSEFEDRLIANRNWLQRVFLQAQQQQLDGIVLFSDANPLMLPAAKDGNKRDGYLETRRQMLSLVSKFKGRVLIIHRQGTRPAAPILWRGNIGEVDTGRARWVKINVRPADSVLFTAEIARQPAAKTP